MIGPWTKDTIQAPIWWRHQMETFSALLALCAGNSPVPGEFPAQRPVTRSFDIFFDQRPNKRLSKQSWGWWFETLSWWLWRHCNKHIVAQTKWPLFSRRHFHVHFLDPIIWVSIKMSLNFFRRIQWRISRRLIKAMPLSELMMLLSNDAYICHSALMTHKHVRLDITFANIIKQIPMEPKSGALFMPLM